MKNLGRYLTDRSNGGHMNPKFWTFREGFSDWGDKNSVILKNSNGCENNWHVTTTKKTFMVLFTWLESVNCGKGYFRNYGFYSSCHMWSGKFWKSRKISKMSVSLANIGLLQIPNWSIWIYFDPYNPKNDPRVQSFEKIQEVRYKLYHTVWPTLKFRDIQWQYLG